MAERCLFCQKNAVDDGLYCEDHIPEQDDPLRLMNRRMLYRDYIQGDEFAAGYGEGPCELDVDSPDDESEK